jgi:hypothetical protein
MRNRRIRKDPVAKIEDMRAISKRCDDPVNGLIKCFTTGHMMYVRDEDRVKLTRDVRNFIRGR